MQQWHTLCEEPVPTNARGRVSGAIWPRKMTGVLGKSRLPRCNHDGRIVEWGFAFRFRPYPDCSFLPTGRRTWWGWFLWPLRASFCAEVKEVIEIR
jgi:hypothetical protein